MTTQAEFYFLTLLIVFSMCSAAELVLRVDRERGVDELSCLQYNGVCKSLEYISNKLGRNCYGLVINIQSKQLHLENVINFEDCSSLSIYGRKNSSSTILCRIREESGFQFRNVSDCNMLDLDIHSCGHYIGLINSAAAMHIHLCNSVTLYNIKFTNSNSTALILSDTSGIISIQNSKFVSNTRQKQIITNNAFPGGVHIQIAQTNPHVMTKYIFMNNTFLHNKENFILTIKPQQSLNDTPKLSTTYGYGLGGGMGIIFMNHTQNVTMSIVKSNFSNNEAHTGGGLYVHFQDNADNNTVQIIESNFSGNIATAGGGLGIGMDKVNIRGNYVMVSNSTFSQNRASYGGGTVVYTIHGDRAQESNDMKFLIFQNCTWENNSGNYSPAVDVGAFRADQFNLGYLLTPVFINCSFYSNTLLKVNKEYYNYINAGVFVISSCTVFFGGNTIFFRNKYTALKLTSGKIELLEGSLLNFTSNEGKKGGAIAMYGFSALVGNRNCLLYFHGNSATIAGGAIFHQTIEQREYVEGKSCFLQHAPPENLTLKERNLTFMFINNSAPEDGTAIYSASFYACFYSYLNDLKSHDLIEFFKYIGWFQFNDSQDGSTGLGTDGFQFEYNQSILNAVPGERITVPISILNEFQHQTLTRLIVIDENNPLNYMLFTNNAVQVFGEPKNRTTLEFQTQDTLRISYYGVSLRFLDCPPGYYFDPSAKSCNCSADNTKFLYKPIIKCNYSLFRAYILRGYWAGLYEYTNGTKLYTSSTALTHFYPQYVINESNYIYLLPKSMEELDLFMCGKDRSGILCEQCSRNLSAYYHSRSNKCGPKTLCHFGILFYTLSELLPVVILFGIIIRYDISFTSGHWNGLVFYSQVVDLVTINLNILNIPNHLATSVKILGYLDVGYRLIYNVLNFDFFSVEPLSFCLWKGAAVMDIIVIKYITTLFTFVLVFLLIRMMNSRCLICFRRNLRIERSVTQGLSAFLILCYSQCTKTTFQILSMQMLLSNEGSPEIPVTQYGGLYLTLDRNT